jgi:phage-related protein
VITVIAALVAAIVVLWNTNEGFRKAVTETWDNIKNAVTSAIQAVRNKIADWKKIGEDIIEGIKEGIKAAAKRLVDAAKNAVQGALNAAKSVLGIKSPSKVFRDQVGAMIGAGIAEGINDSSGLVNSAMGKLNKQLAADATVRLGATGKTEGQAPEVDTAATAKAGSTMNVTINVRSAADAIRELNVLNKQLASTI